MVQFEVGKHYDGAICLARRGKKETWVYMPLHKEGQPMPEYWPRGKSGIYVDWYRVRVVNGVECAGPDWMEFRADNWLTDSERALKSEIVNPTKNKAKRKSKKQIEREEFAESCRAAREFYSSVARDAIKGAFVAAKKTAGFFAKIVGAFAYIFSKKSTPMYSRRKT